MRVLFAFAATVLVCTATTTTTTTVRPAADERGGGGWAADVLAYLDGCRSRDFAECLSRDLALTVDRAIRGNQTYRLNRYLTVTATAGNRTHDDHRSGVTAGRSDCGVTARLLDLFNALHVRYEPEEMDDRPTEVDGPGVFEGRKKNKFGKKHKMSMMMAATSMGMTIIGGMFTKMMMGGVSLIAMKALIIAKFALLLAAVIALKKLMHGSGGGGGGGGGAIAQPSWGGFSGGGGGNEPGGYHRSSGRHLDDEQSVWAAASGLAYRHQLDRGGSSARVPQ